MSKKTGQLLIVRVRFLNNTISISCIPFLDKENNGENRRLPLELRKFFLEYYGKSFQKNSQSERKNMLVVVHSTVIKPNHPNF